METRHSYFLYGAVSVLSLADFQTRILDKKAFQIAVFLCLVLGLIFGFWHEYDKWKFSKEKREE